MKHAIQNIHFVGIGGAGMSGIAEVLLNLGFRVSGSDLQTNAAVKRLQAQGAKVCIGHAESNLETAEVVVTSTAVSAENPEVKAAHQRLIPVVPRAVMLAELMRMKHGIAIAGTHGKTTTTSLVASVLHEGGMDPTFVIGGRLNSAGANAKLGTGDMIVVEADESDASFLNLLPMTAVVTNIDADHMETYGHDFGRLRQAFIDFLHRMPFYGTAIVCVDDPNVRDLLPEIARPIVGYGVSEDAKIRAVDIKAEQDRMVFTVQRKLRPGQADLKISLALPGHHNVLNALAAVAVADEMDVPDDAVVRALAQFEGVGRRFQSYGDVALPQGGSMRVIDDYGHHPVEMAATIAAARGAFPTRRLVLAFQPHRFTRTRDCFDDFVAVVGHADALILADVYAAGEPPIVAADGRALARALRVAGQIEPVFVADIADLATQIFQHARANDVVVCMGAGSISQVPAQLVAMAAPTTEANL